jgi:tetratricopeptide (TPR) repeat protein
VTLAVLAGACTRGPSFTVARRLDGERRVGTFISPYAYEWFVRGEFALALGKFREAAAAFRRARADSGDDPLLLARLADALAKSGDPEGALEVIDEGLDATPCAEALHLAKGEVLESLARDGAALRAMAQAYECAPESESAPLAMAALLTKRGRAHEAQDVLRRFLDRTGKGSVFALRTELELALLEHNVEACMVAAERLQKRGRLGETELVRVAETLRAAGARDAALRVLRVLPAPRKPRLLWLGLLGETGRTAEAEAYLKSESAEAFGDRLALVRAVLALRMPGLALELLGPRAANEGAEAPVLRARGLLMLGDEGGAASSLAAVASNTSASAEAAALTVLLLNGAGLPALAEELSQAQRLDGR